MRKITICTGSGVILDTLYKAVSEEQAIAILRFYISNSVSADAGTVESSTGELEYTIHPTPAEAR